MIRVLHKAFDILEFLVAEADRPRGLGEISGDLGLNAGTCANILKTMVRRGYVEQVAPKKGYLLGPMAYHLAGRRPYRRDLLKAAEPAIADLAKDVHETVLLVTLCQCRRFILCEARGDQDVQVRSDIIASDDVYETPTGRLLLAHLAAEQLKAFVTTRGLPGAVWPEARSRSGLKRALEGIREAGRVVDVSKPQVAAAAFPIRDEEAIVAALGLYLPRFRFKGTHRKRVLAGLQGTAKRISRRVSEYSSRSNA